jgi:hypothetical protein
VLDLALVALQATEGDAGQRSQSFGEFDGRATGEYAAAPVAHIDIDENADRDVGRLRRGGELFPGRRIVDDDVMRASRAIATRRASFAPPTSSPVINTSGMPLAIMTSASPSFEQQMPTAPAASCILATIGVLWALACGRMPIGA